MPDITESRVASYREASSRRRTSQLRLRIAQLEAEQIQRAIVFEAARRGPKDSTISKSAQEGPGGGPLSSADVSALRYFLTSSHEKSDRTSLPGRFVLAVISAPSDSTRKCWVFLLTL
jgi:hypothetical protein